MTFVLKEKVQFGFHRQAGVNVFVSRTSHRAMSIDQACGAGLVYTARPLRGEVEFEVRLLDYSGSYKGSLKMGLLRRRVTTPSFSLSIPRPSEHRDNSCVWFSRFKRRTEFQNNLGAVHLLRYYGLVDLCELREDHRMGLRVSSQGELSFFVNGMMQGVAAHGVYQSGYEVYVFLELVEGYRAVEITRAGACVLVHVYVCVYVRTCMYVHMYVCMYGMTCNNACVLTFDLDIRIITLLINYAMCVCLYSL